MFNIDLLSRILEMNVAINIRIGFWCINLKVWQKIIIFDLKKHIKRDTIFFMSIKLA